MKYYNEDIEEVYQNLNTSENGLTNEEVKIRINQYGLNILEEGKKKTKLSIFETVSEFNDYFVISSRYSITHLCFNW